MPTKIDFIGGNTKRCLMAMALPMIAAMFLNMMYNLVDSLWIGNLLGETAYVSKIKVGVKVKHKAFGIGTVAAIQPDMVTVRFGSVEKKFLLPAAIVQGYLTVVEN